MVSLHALVRYYAELVADDDYQRAYEKVDASTAQHFFLINEFLRKFYRNGDVVVSPACGFGFEQFLAPEYNWIGLDNDQDLVKKANSVCTCFGLPKRVNVWDVESDPLPKGDILYIRRFCGGGTDACLGQAVKLGYRHIIIQSCCPSNKQELAMSLYGDVPFFVWDDIRLYAWAPIDCLREEAIVQMNNIRTDYLNRNGYTAQSYKIYQQRSGNNSGHANLMPIIIASKNP